MDFPFRKKMVDLKNHNHFMRFLWFKTLAYREKRSKEKSDIECIKSGFTRAFGYEPNLGNPQTFYEKLNWMKLHYRNDLMPIVADKYLVHDYLRGEGYSYLLNDIIGVWDSVDEFNEKELPDRFVLKATHASGTGWNLIVKDKASVAWFPFKKVMRQWLKQKIDWMGREWHYAEMTPRIICEKYLEDESGELRDYKFHCFGGVAKFVSVFYGRYSGDGKHHFSLDREWHLLPLTFDSVNNPSDFNMDKPANLDEMFNLAEKLSKPFPYVRVDFYNVKGKIYFGEFTFFNASGFSSSFTDEAQRIIGEWLILPCANN